MFLEMLMQGLARQSEKDQLRQALRSSPNQDSNQGIVDLPSDPTPGPGYSTGNGPMTDPANGLPDDPNAEKWQRMSKATSGYRTALENDHGVNKDWLNTASLAQLRGEVQRRGMQRAEEEHHAKMLDWMAKALDDQGIGDAINAYAKGSPDPGGITSQMEAEGYTPTPQELQAQQTPQDRMLAAMSTPGFRGRTAPKILEALERYGAMTGPGAKPNFQDIPGTDSTLMTFGKTSQVVPKSATQPKTSPIFDEEGNQTGSMYFDGKKWVLPKTAANGQLLPVIDPGTKKPIRGLGMDATGKVHDWRSEMEKTMGPAPDQPAVPAAAPAPGILEGVYNRLFGPAKTNAPAAAASAPAGGIVVNSKADYDALPSGATYIVNGKTCRKK